MKVRDRTKSGINGRKSSKSNMINSMGSQEEEFGKTLWVVSETGIVASDLPGKT